MTLDIAFDENVKSIAVSFEENANAIITDFGEIQHITSDANAYDGEYIIKPMPYKEQELLTKNKTMLEDVKVLAIPYYETSNQSGTTLVIGE